MNLYPSNHGLVDLKSVSSIKTSIRYDLKDISKIKRDKWRSSDISAEIISSLRSGMADLKLQIAQSFIKNETGNCTKSISKTDSKLCKTRAEDDSVRKLNLSSEISENLKEKAKPFYMKHAKQKIFTNQKLLKEMLAKQLRSNKEMDDYGCKIGNNFKY